MRAIEVRLALVLLVACILPQGGIAAPVGSGSVMNDRTPNEPTRESRLFVANSGDGVKQVGSNSFVAGRDPSTSADILAHDLLAYQPPVLGGTVLLRTGADLYFSSREHRRAEADSATGTGTGSAGQNSDLDRPDSGNFVNDFEPRREVFTLSTEEPVQQALDFYNGGSEILLSSSEVSVTAPIPREAWVFLPILASLVTFLHRSARKRI